MLLPVCLLCRWISLLNTVLSMIKSMFLMKTEQVTKEICAQKRPFNILCLDFSQFMLTLDVIVVV